MAKPKTIIVTSHKGGVGKSTLTAQLGMALARRGRSALLIDCDLGMRCLDLIMGLSDDVVYDITDVAQRNIPVKRAVVRDRRSELLSLLAAPYRFDGTMTATQFKSVVEQAAAEINPDYIIIDAPGDMTPSLDFAVKTAKTALVVATHQPAAIRAAEVTSLRLAEVGIDECRLIINCFDGDGVRKGKLPGIIELIDRTSLRLLGVVPHDFAISDAQREGKLVGELSSHNAETAFANIAARICGETLPLFSGFRGINRKSYIR